MNIPALSIIAAAYLVTLLTSGWVVKKALVWTKHDAPLGDAATARSGLLIGKCENILVVTLVLLDGLTAVALIFTAKSLIRRDAVADTEYLLGGTLVNVTYSIHIALLAQLVAKQYGLP